MKQVKLLGEGSSAEEIRSELKKMPKKKQKQKRASIPTGSKKAHTQTTASKLKQ